MTVSVLEQEEAPPGCLARVVPSLKQEPREKQTWCVIRSHFHVSDKNFLNSYHFLNVPSRMGAGGRGLVL